MAKGFSEPVQVTRTVLPPLGEFTALLEVAWASHRVTNHGPLVCRLEEELASYLGVRHVLAVANGTLALQLCLRALDCTGEVVTTPFTYVATASSIVWEGCRPVFADVDEDSLCMDPSRLEEAIGPRTSAILPVHVFGNTCDVGRLGEVAARHGLPVVYDAAHAFGVRHGGESVAAWGDLVAFSFHATKLFHTVEGGAIATNDAALADRVRLLRNFGHTAPEAFGGLGINAKLSELHAAMGLCLLPRVPDLIAARGKVVEAYDAVFSGVPGIRRVRPPGTAESNNAYYPVVFDSHGTRESVAKALEACNVFPRRYFSPSLTALPYVRTPPMPVSDSVADRILCLPLYAGLGARDAARIGECVIAAVSGSPPSCP